MKLKILILAMTLSLAALAHGATNDLTGLLQKGLFEEEANRDLTAAIANYQSLANAFDKDRQLAATAVFRLGECYRKLGKNNEAAAQYQRIIKEFSDQQTLVTLSRQNLAGLNMASAPASSGVNESSLVDAEANVALLQAQIEEIKKMPRDQQRIYVEQYLSNPILVTLIQELDLAQQSLIKLKADYTPDHPKYKNAEEMVDDLNHKIDAQIEGVILGLQSKLAVAQAQLNVLRQQQSEIAGTPDGSGGSDALLRLQIQRAQEQLDDSEKQERELLKTFTPDNPRIVELKKKILTEITTLASLAGKLQASQSAAAESANPVTTDEEQQEIRRIQVMIQNSPDLINAPGIDGSTPLLAAATKGQLIVAKYLLDHGADVDAISGNHVDVPLSSAARNGHKAMVELLLARGAEVNGHGALNPLLEAVQKGYVAVAEVLLAHKADVNPHMGTMPIHVAAGDGKTELLQLLIQHGADVNATDNEGRTPLELAAARSNTNVAKLLLESKAAIAPSDKSGMTPLHQAAKAGQTEMVSLLLNSGATVDPTNGDGTTPLMLAVAWDKTDAVRELLKHKANPNREGSGPYPFNGQLTRSSPIVFAILKGNEDILKMLLNAGANPEGDSQYGVPLFLAIQYNRLEGVRLLLEHGANLNRLLDGFPPLNYALKPNRDIRIASLLLDKGADANAKDKDGFLPLARTSDPEVGRWLVDHKADVNGRFTDQLTPLIAVSDTNYMRFLLEAGAKPDLQDTNGNTALHHRTSSGQFEAVAILLEYKADPNIQNDLGLTPLDIAKSGEKGTIQNGMFVSPNVSADSEKKIADLLAQAGGLTNLPKRNRIEVRRASNFALAFSKGSHNWNRYSLLEVIAGEYKLLTQNTAGAWTKGSGARGNLWNNCLRFPDFKNVIVYRRTDGSAKQKAINVDVEEILHSGDCSRDMWLDWGDVIEIPESDHPVDVGWQGLSAETVTALTNCLARQVTVIVKGVTTPLKLTPEIRVQYHTQGNESGDGLELTYVSFMLRSVLDNSKLVRVSSDLSRVKVTRVDPESKKKQEWVVDCTDSEQADLWLRDGDVVDVPEK